MRPDQSMDQSRATGWHHSGVRNQQLAALPEKGRYEYRIWPLVAHPAISVLYRDWALSKAERRADIYLLQPSSEQILAKLRNGESVEIKRLAARVGTIEHWTMPIAKDFPLTPSIAAAVSELLQLPKGLTATSGMTAAHLLSEVAASVVPQTVRKSRLLFRSGECRAEICRVAINDWAGLTIALEASEIPAIARAISNLGIGRLPNRSYGEVLLRFLNVSLDGCRLPKSGVEASFEGGRHNA